MNNDNNNNNNSNGKDSKPPHHRRMNKELEDEFRDRQEEFRLIERFKRVTARRVHQMVQLASNDENDEKFKMSPSEREAIQSLNGMGLKEGIAASLVTFLVLRRGPIYVARFVYNRRLQSRQGGIHNNHNNSNTPPPTAADGYQFNALPKNSNPFQNTSTATANNGGLRPDFPRSRNFVIRSIWWVFDVTLSVMMGASVTMAYTDVSHIRTTVTELPLQQGPSLSSRVLCKPLAQELYQVQSEHNPAYQRLVRYNREVANSSSSSSTKNSPPQNHNHPAAFYLQGIQQYVANCERRHYAEREWKQERGYNNMEGDDHDKNDNDMGVVDLPRTISPTAPRLSYQHHQDDDASRHDDFFEDSDEMTTSMDWTEANTFTTDQEEDNENSRN